jgi:ABC-type branched-subunit amino acid transport system substrate-binding protein
MASSVALGVLLLGLVLGNVARADSGDDTQVRGVGDVAAGRALYMEGRRADGTPLRGRGHGGMLLTGSQAACANCHRSSGLGSMEGRIYIPPLAGDTLLRAMPPGKGPSATGVGRPAYTPAALQAALRTGVDPGGRTLDVLMPRYDLGTEEVAALLRYLGDLGQAQAGAADSGPLHFATVVAPGVPASEWKAMVEVLQACFAEHNAGPPEVPGRRKLAASMTLRQPRSWQLQVWQLEGKEANWEQQLARFAAQQPVFAVVGGISAGTWSPVHRFCERSQRPCLFPHVEVPVDNQGAFYSLYLSKSVLLEAALIAQHIASVPGTKRVVQVVRSSDPGALAGAAALGRLLDASHVAHDMLEVQDEVTAVTEALAASGPQDSFVMWLRPDDMGRLVAAAAPAAQLFVSATLAGEDVLPLPDSWKTRTLVAYPFELPAVRSERTQRLHQWLRGKGLDTDSERIRSDAFLACSALGRGMQDAERGLGPEYLIEKLESNIERWPETGLYPRLALGPGQRFASKTGYLVRFDKDSGRLAATAERSAP